MDFRDCAGSIEPFLPAVLDGNRLARTSGFLWAVKWLSFRGNLDRNTTRMQMASLSRFPKTLSGFLPIASCLLLHSAGVAEKPNILLLVSDDQGYHDLGAINEEILTPNLDRLAREGTRLTSFYVAWPACTPSRGAFLSGRYPQRNGTFDMIRNEAPDYGHRYNEEEYAVTFEKIGGMDTREILLPQMLKSAGYRSGIYGKWDLGTLKRFLPTSRGFDDFYGLVNTGIDYYTHERYGVHSMYRNEIRTEEDRGTYCTYLFEREALRFLSDHAGKEPFFLYVPFNAPHGSSSLDPKIRGTVQAPPEFERLYPPVKEEFQKGSKYGKETLVPTKEETIPGLSGGGDLHGRLDRQAARCAGRKGTRRQHHRDLFQRQRGERRRQQ